MATPQARSGAAFFFLIVVLSLLAGCSTVREPQAPASVVTPWKAPGAEIGRGMASWYGPGFQGKRTAGGERFDEQELTAAHRTLPFGSRVLVRNVRTGREVVVRINDRGPWVPDRVIDLSRAAAAALDMLQAGEAPVVLLSP